MDCYNVIIFNASINLIEIFKCGVLQLMQECGPAGLKAAMELLGYKGGLCRSPLPPISDEKVANIKRTLEKDGFL